MGCGLIFFTPVRTARGFYRYYEISSPLCAPFVGFTAGKATLVGVVDPELSSLGVVPEGLFLTCKL